MSIKRALALFSLLFISVMIKAQAVQAQPKPPVYLWYEPEWFSGIEGGFGYWTGTAKPTGTGVALLLAFNNDWLWRHLFENSTLVNRC